MEHLNQTSLDAIARIIEQHQNKEGPVKLILHDIQRACGYIPIEALPMIASACHKPVAEIYGVVSFYAQFTGVWHFKETLSNTSPCKQRIFLMKSCQIDWFPL